MPAISPFDLFSQAQFLVVTMVVVIIGPGLLVGLLVAVFQAATQINEQTLSFLPRLLVTLLTTIITGHWLLQKLVDLTTTVFNTIPLMIG